MGKEVIQVDFKPDGEHRAPEGDDIMWSVLGALGLLVVAALIVTLMPLLLPVLLVAAVLAAFSTRRAAQRNHHLRKLGWPAHRVGVKNYLGYLATWFFGLLALVPLFFLGALAVVAGVMILGVAVIFALLSSMFRAE
ncbi:MAG: hypothetical protein ACYTAN_06595 [Planctomycetota bacterium]|jgi:hypothetical protein